MSEKLLTALKLTDILACRIPTVLVFALQGGKEYLMRAHFGLPSVENENLEGRPPIHIKFEIPYFTVSGIQVSFDMNSCNSFTYL